MLVKTKQLCVKIRTHKRLMRSLSALSKLKMPRHKPTMRLKKLKLLKKTLKLNTRMKPKKRKWKLTMPTIKRRMKKLSNALLPKINKHRMRIKPIAKKPKLNSTPKNGLIPRSLRMRKLQALRFVLLKRLIKEL